MQALRYSVAVLIGLTLAPTALASEAETSASASDSRYQRNGTATATARYEGDLGFARTNSRSGPVSSARGVAVGFDESGLSLSVSNAIAPRLGAAIAMTFNLSIDRDGDVSGSTGLALARGPLQQAVTAGGQVGTGRYVDGATAFTSGQTDRFGRVQATTRSYSSASQRHVVVRRYPAPAVRRYAPSEIQHYRR
jgi:hypothetical protein